MPVSLDAARWLAADVLRPGHFFSTLPLVWRQDAAETSRWEVFQGRLLDPAHTRQEATFETWNVHEETASGPSAEPILSLKLDAGRGVLHVVRGVENYVHEAYGEGNVIQTREARRWVRELVASFDLGRFGSSPELRDEVTAALARAVTGARLPLTPVEAPLPGFSFGRFYYFAETVTDGQPITNPDTLLTWLGPETQRGRTSRLLELWLRGTPVESMNPEVFLLGFKWAFCNDFGGDKRRAFRIALGAMFDDVSLTPWTEFVPRTLALMDWAEQFTFLTAETAVDSESQLLRLVCRHLTAYDLVTFHHRGANYPDALLLDAVLNDYLARIEKHPDLFAGDAGRVRRRALRQAYLLRRRYENHPVPDVPTSPGEHARVLPAGYSRVPEEQLLDPKTRRRKLYENDPLLARLSPAALAVLRQSVADLSHADERRELGAAVFLDRPFGGAKAPVEPDGTPLLAGLAYSRSVAAGRLRMLWRDLGMAEGDMSDLALPGLTLDRVGLPSRPGTVSLHDAGRAAPDFVFLHTLPGSVRALGRWIDFGEFSERVAGRVLLARAPAGQGIRVYDDELRPFVEIVPRYEDGYVSRRGVEFPAAGVTLSGL